MSVPARPLRADAARNRARVLETAYETFAAEGLSVPIDEIARRAGVGAGTVYRHFPTKEDLFGAVVESRLRHIIDAGHALLDDPGPGEALFMFLRSMVLDFGATDQGLVDALGGLGIDIDSAAPDAEEAFRGTARRTAGSRAGRRDRAARRRRARDQGAPGGLPGHAGLRQGAGRAGDRRRHRRFTPVAIGPAASCTRYRRVLKMTLALAIGEC